jgi:hypothetical protein
MTSPNRTKKPTDRDVLHARERTRSQTVTSHYYENDHGADLHPPPPPSARPRCPMTFNINGIMQPSRLGMLEDFLRRHNVGIALLQEVTLPMLNAIQHYKSYLNTGTDQRGTAMLTKNGITKTNVKRLPSGRGIAALFQRTWIINE